MHYLMYEIYSNLSHWTEFFMIKFSNDYSFKNHWRRYLEHFTLNRLDSIDLTLWNATFYLQKYYHCCKFVTLRMRMTSLWLLHDFTLYETFSSSQCWTNLRNKKVLIFIDTITILEISGYKFFWKTNLNNKKFWKNWNAIKNSIIVSLVLFYRCETCLFFWQKTSYLFIKLHISFRLLTVWR